MKYFRTKAGRINATRTTPTSYRKLIRIAPEPAMIAGLTTFPSKNQSAQSPKVDACSLSFLIFHLLGHSLERSNRIEIQRIANADQGVYLRVESMEGTITVAAFIHDNLS